MDFTKEQLSDAFINHFNREKVIVITLQRKDGRHGKYCVLDGTRIIVVSRKWAMIHSTGIISPI